MINIKILRQLFIFLVILILGGLIFWEILPYFSGVLGAIILYILLKKIMAKLVKFGWHPSLAAGFLMVSSFIIILLPIAGVILMLSNKIEVAVNNSEKVFKIVQAQFSSWESKLGYDLTSKIDTSAISNWVSENLQGLAGGTFTTIIAIAIMYFALFYMLTNRKKLRESLFEYIPFNNNSLKIIGNETRKMVRANALGIPLVAVAQGIVAFIGFLLFGIENSFFWAVIVTFGSMIPFVGNFLGTIPLFILLISNGNSFQAWGILLYGIIIIGSTDNIIRLFILKKLDDVHPLITLIGVIIGLPLFGFLGLIFGPLLISLFIIALKIYKKEYSQDAIEKV